MGERLIVDPDLELVPVLHYRQRVPADVEGVIEGPLVATRKECEKFG